MTEPTTTEPTASETPPRATSRPALPTTIRWIGFLLFLGLVGCPDTKETKDAPATTATPAAPRPPADGFTAADERAWPGRIVVDGRLDEWPTNAPAVSDAMGDAAAPFDVTWLRAKIEGERLFVAFDTREETNLYAGPGAGLVLVVEGERRIRVDFRKRRVTIDGRRASFGDLDAMVAPTHASRRFEIALRHAGPARVHLEGADEVAPLAVEPPPEKVEVPTRSPARAPGTWLRIATLNTERAGLVDAARAAATKRVIAAADADVICLQELGGADRDALERALPGHHIHATRGPGIIGNAVVSRRPLRPLALESPRLAAAYVAGERPLVVVSLHLPCCGHLGSDQDHARLDEARRLAALLGDLRRGAVAGVPADAAIVVAGDFNDVGARALRQSLAAADLTLAPATHLRRPATFTWRKASSRFPPSTLDLVFHGTDLQKMGGFVLDSTELDDATLELLGLERLDSLASDHHLVVVDLGLR